MDIPAVTLDQSDTVLTAQDIAALRSSLSGPVILPGEGSYEEARRVWNRMIDKRPAVIVRCTSASDVIEAVRFARTRELLVAVRGGGHNVAGASTCDDGLVIDLSPMKGIRVDPARRTVRAEGGVTWGELDRETQTVGLATPGGLVTTTGIAGLTLGGGLGHLRNRYGLCIDNLLSVDIVTADGAELTASPAENEDLFWAVRGGGGNFGVVTAFEFQLHSVGPEITLCAPYYPAEMAPEVIRFWRDFVESAPDELSSIVVLWRVPAIPDFPAEAHGEPVIIPMAAHCGPLADGERVIRPLRELGTPIVDLSGPISYLTLQQLFDPFFEQGSYYYFKSLRLDRLDDAAIDTFLMHGAACPSVRTDMSFWHFGPTVRDVPADATAYGDRSAPFLFTIDSAWDNPGDTERNLVWSRDYWKAMKEHSTGGMYVNFPGLGEEGEDLVRAAYGPNYERLATIKRAYDPANLFRLNQNIRPT